MVRKAVQNSTGPSVRGSVLENVQERRTPFPHFVSMQAFDRAVADAAYAWLHAHAHWHHHVSTFFDQHERGLIDADLPRELRDALVSPAVLRLLRQRMETLFAVSMADVFDVVAHRLVPGQGIGLHTDRPSAGDETHRLVINLGREFDDSQGGHLILFHGRDPDDFACAFRSIHNTAVGLEMSERSYHAVADVIAGIRYTIVYSFWRADCTDTVKDSAARIEGERLVSMRRRPMPRRERTDP